MRGVIRLTMSGEPVELKCSIGLAVAIEEATNSGLLELAGRISRESARIVTIQAVLEQAYKASERPELAKTVLDMIDERGIVAAQIQAITIIDEYFKQPANAKPAKVGAGKAGKAPAH